MMGFLTKWIAAGLYGIAMARFFQGRHSEAARLLEKVCRLAPDEERMELRYAYLGRSYLSLGQHKKALGLLSRAYEPYRIQSQSPEDEFEQRQFIEFLHAFRDILRITGRPDRAQEIAHEAEEYVAAMEEKKRISSRPA